MLLPLGNPLVPYETPYHVVELIIQLLKITFNELPPDNPFYYDPDDFNHSKILFDTTYNKESNAVAKPLIVVSRGQQSFATIDLGDRTPILHAIGEGHVTSQFSNFIDANLEIRVISKNKPEVEILGQHVFAFIMCVRTILNRYVHVHMIRQVDLTPVQRQDKDTEAYMCMLNMAYVMQPKWDEFLPAERLKQIAFRMFNETVDKTWVKGEVSEKSQ